MTYGVGLGGVEVGADDAVFFDFAEDGLCVGVGEGGRHFDFGLWFWWEDGVGGGSIVRGWVVECMFWKRNKKVSVELI